MVRHVKRHSYTLSARSPTVNMPPQSTPCTNVQSMLLDPSQCFVRQQGKAHLPTLNMPFFKKVQLVKNPISMLLDPTSMLCSAARESPLVHSEHPLFLQSPPRRNVKCMVLDPRQCFVQQQGKALSGCHNTTRLPCPLLVLLGARLPCPLLVLLGARLPCPLLVLLGTRLPCALFVLWGCHHTTRLPCALFVLLRL